MERLSAQTSVSSAATAGDRADAFSTPSAPSDQMDKPPRAPLSPPLSPIFPLPNAKVSHYTKPAIPPRFPRHPCPTPHYTLSLLSSEHEAQRLFGPSFTLRSPVTGELLGPFALLSYTDAWIPKYCRYIHSVVSTPVFTLRERELIVLAVAGVTCAEYVVDSHREVAIAAGLRGETVQCALEGATWMEIIGLNGREKNVYRVASEMAGNWGRLGEETWRAVVAEDKAKTRREEGWLEGEVAEDVGAEGDHNGEDVPADIENDKPSIASARSEEENERKPQRLTREELATLAQVLASTMFVSVLVNCADVEAPQSETDIVQQP
ncbi:hypothetical protein SVAN01_08072 [Stagonosporopsis vannaccii]|nr:hypothetical protein SVAN01_08072 [Stagonosporopsis vannaccii]